MEDKTFELLTKMYSEFSKRFDGVETRLGTLENKLGTLEGGQKTIESRLTKLELMIDNDVKKDLSALYDGYQKNHEKLIVLEQKIDDLSDRVDKQEVEIKVIKGGKS